MAKKKIDWLLELEEDGMVRVDYMIPLIAYKPSSQLLEAVDDMEPKVLREILGKGKHIDELIIGDDNREIADYLLENRIGEYIAQVSTPIMDEGNMYSWGFTYNKYIIGTSIEDLIEKALKWRDKLENRKSGKKQTDKS